MTRLIWRKVVFEIRGAMLCKSAKMSVMGFSGKLLGEHLNFTRLALFCQFNFGEGIVLFCNLLIGFRFTKITPFLQ